MYVHVLVFSDTRSFSYPFQIFTKNSSHTLEWDQH